MPTEVDLPESVGGPVSVSPWEEAWPDNLPMEPPSDLRAALHHTPPGMVPRWRRLLVGLLIVQVGLIASMATVCAFQFRVFSIIDEEAHYSYVQQIAEHGSLPVLGTSLTSRQGLAIAQGTYPHRAPALPPRGQLRRLDYEALQPPLYYLAAVPAFDLTSNYLDKVYSVRLFDVLLLLGTLVCMGRLARVALKQRWMVGFSFALVFFALPGVIVRLVTISNLALALPLTIVFATELWIGWERHSGRRLTLAGLFLGLCVLTQLEQILLVPVFAVVLVAEGARRWRATAPEPSPDLPRAARRRHLLVLAPLAAAALVPIVLTAPWFIFNEVNYHMLTAGPIAVAEQLSTVNPHHIHFPLSRLPNDTVNFLIDPTLPSEWGAALHHQPTLSYLSLLLDVLLIPAALVFIVGLGWRLRSVRVAILGLPWVMNILELWYIRYGEQWVIVVRYTYTTVPILLVLGAGATLCMVRSRALPVVVTAGATVSVAVLWAFFLWSYTGPWALT